MSPDKNKIIKGFKKAINERSLESMNSSLYSFFHLYCGFIAHYNIHGFKDYYRGRNFLEFLSQFTQPPFYLRSHDEYGEWIQEMIDYARAHEKQIRFEFDNEVLNKKLKMLQALAEDLGYEIIPKQDKAIPLSIEQHGQLALL